MDLFGFRPEVLAALTQVPEIKAQVKAVATDVRDLARQRAGEGAEHIIVANVYDRDTQRVEYHVGWRPEHFYMGFKELGTVHQQAEPFLRPAADEINRR